MSRIKDEDEIDMKIIKEYEEDIENGNIESYTHDEIVKILGLDDPARLDSIADRILNDNMEALKELAKQMKLFIK